MQTQLTNNNHPSIPIFDLHLESPGNKADPPDNQGGGNAPSGAPQPDEKDSGKDSESESVE
jgi:hypothetical protein